MRIVIRIKSSSKTDEQVPNCMQRKRDINRISKDDYYNLLFIAFQLGDYVWKITLYPHVMCLIGLKELLQDMNKMMDMDEAKLFFY